MADTAEKKRVRYIDFFKALLMILVIAGHANFANGGVKAWIYAFHMPAFFFASGLVLKNGSVTGFKSACGKVWKYFIRLMLPFFIWALIYAALSGRNLLKIAYASHQTLERAGTLTSLWFLPALFIALTLFTVFELILRRRFNLPVKLILAVLAIAAAAFFPRLKNGYPWCVNAACAAFGFLLLGNVSSPAILSFRAFAGEKKAGIPLAILAVCLFFGATFVYLANIPKGGYVKMSDGLYGNYPLFVAGAIAGTGFVLSLSLLLDRLIPEDKPKKFRPLTYLGMNTLCAFAVQKPIIRCFNAVFRRVAVPNVLALVVTVIGTAVGCCLTAWFLNRYAPALVGKEPKARREEKR